MYACFRNFMLIIFVQNGAIGIKIGFGWNGGWSNEAIVNELNTLYFIYSKTISRLGFYSGN